MKNIVSLLFFVLATSSTAFAQYFFGAQVSHQDSCCISIKAGVKNGVDNWHVVVDGLTSYNSSSPEYTGNEILHCFDGNGSHTVKFYVNGEFYWSRIVDITNCQGDCSICDIPSMVVDAAITDTCAREIFVCARFPSINGQSGYSNLCTNPVYTWDYGDGSPVVSTGNSIHSTYSYDEPGTYNVCVTLSLTNPNGGTCVTTECVEIVIPECDEECCGMQIGDLSFDISPVDSCTVFVNANDPNFSLGGCSTPTLSWTINGVLAVGETGTSLLTTLNGAGPHEVCLNLVNDSCSISSCTMISLPNCPGTCDACDIKPLVLDLDIVDTCANEVWIDTRFLNVNGGTPYSDSCTNVTYTWDYGDGTPAASTGSTNYVFHNYADTGTYKVCVTLSMINPDGELCTVRRCGEIYVPGCKKDSCCDIQLGNLEFRILNPSTCLVAVRAIPATFDEGSCDATLSWTANGIPVAGQTSSFMVTTLTGAGPHDVCLTMTSGSCTLTSCVTIDGCRDDDKIGDGKISDDGRSKNLSGDTQAWETNRELALFPNPAINELNMVFSEDIERLQLVDITGRVVREEQVSNTTQLSINIRQLATGVYFVKAIDRNGELRTTEQFVKIR